MCVEHTQNCVVKHVGLWSKYYQIIAIVNYELIQQFSGNLLLFISPQCLYVNKYCTLPMINYENSSK